MSHSRVSDGPSIARRGAVVAGSGALFTVGLLIDVLGIINVPGAVELPAVKGGEITLTGIGPALVLFIALAWSSVFWLNRAPVVALIAGGILAVIGTSYLLLLVAAVAYVHRWRAQTRLIAVAVGAVVLLYVVREVVSPWGVAFSWFFTSRPDAHEEPAWDLVSIITALISMGAAVMVVFTSRARQRVRHSEARATEELQRADALTEQMVRQTEREHIARDMHDALAHRLSVLSLHAGALEGSSGSDPRASEIARTVREQSHAALQDMRGLIGDLRSGPRESTPPTMRAVWSLLASLRAGGVPMIAYVVIDAPERVSAQLDSAVYRIVQESLTNAIKHSPGSTVDVFVQAEPVDGVRIRISNPLRASTQQTIPGGGNGIIGIRERAIALEGSAWIGSHDSTFIVDVMLPWREHDPVPR